MNSLKRFLKVMLFTGVLALAGPVLIFALIMLLSPDAHLRSDINYDEHVRPLAKALAMWFGLMFFVGFLSFLVGMTKRFTVALGDPETFVARMDAAARAVRYRPQRRDGNQITYKPPFFAFLAEKIRVELGDGSATIIAPRGLRKKLEKKLAAGA
jgi:hypothetical protein